MNFGDTVSIKGCSLKSRHLETGSGCAAVDAVLGGSVPNTSTVIYDEVSSRAYADVLLRLASSEGLHEEHDILYVSSPLDEDDLMEKLPSRSVEGSSESKKAAPPDESMQIAWRYAPVKQIESSVSKGISKYDLATTVTPETRAASSTKIYRYPSTVDVPFSYQGLTNILKELLNRPEYAKSKGPRPPNSPKPRLLRVIIRGLGSPLWEDAETVRQFIVRLPHIMRHAYAVLFASTNTRAMSEESSRQLETIADAFFRLESMNEEEKKMYDKAHGYWRIIRLPRLISLAPTPPPSTDLSFELHRRSFDIKILHLPPALGDEETDKKMVGSCGAALEF
ncbi:elpc-4 [Pristionchus pacificus]|nr:elpc-4 [Pristionchus pacificus]